MINLKKTAKTENLVKHYFSMYQGSGLSLTWTFEEYLQSLYLSADVKHKAQIKTVQQWCERMEILLYETSF